MNFSRGDLTIIISMGLAVILMSFTFTALGLANEDVKENEIPEFNMTANKFDMAQAFPDNPGTPSRVFLTWTENLAGDSDNAVWLHGDTSDGVQITTYNTGSKSDPQAKFVYANWTNGNSTTTEKYLNETGDRISIDENQYNLVVTWESVRNLNESNMHYELKVEIDEQDPTDGGFLSRIPLAGGIFNAGEAIASIVGYIGVVFWWFSATLLEVVVNMVIMIYNVLAFFVSFMHFLLTTYSGIITGVSPWASVILAIPGVLLMFEFTKLILIGIKLLPTT